MTVLTRFAPSPTGRLHLGHAFSALTAFGFAQAHGGCMALRIEDIDQTRCRRDFETAIYEDLAWLGLTWPSDVRRQSEHTDAYQATLQRLRDLGVVYRCFKTRREIAEASAQAPHAGDDNSVIYRGPSLPMSKDEEALRLAQGQSYAWRLSISYSHDLLGEEFARLVFEEHGEGPKGEHGEIRARPDHAGDVILARKDCPTSYHLAVVHDDALQGMTHILRGADLFEATSVHVLLQRLLGYATPIYRHHRLLVGPDGRRYAKRDNATTLAALRQDGVTPAEIKERLGMRS